MSRLRPKLTFANVVSCLALFLALGGLAVAAGLPKNSVGPKQLKKNSVTAAKVKKEAITATKVKKGTLTGTQISVSTLPTVPSAVSAQTLGGKSADQISQGSKLRCPTGTELAAGVCFETTERSPAALTKALEICGNADRSLPGMGELAAFLLGVDPTAESWTGSPFTKGLELFGVAAYSEVGLLALVISEASTPHPFRCVTQPTN